MGDSTRNIENVQSHATVHSFLSSAPPIKNELDLEK